MLKAVLFDLDDTLLDWTNKSVEWIDHERKSLEKVYEFLQPTLLNLENPSEFYDLVRHYSRQGWEMSMETLIAPSYPKAMFSALKHLGVPDEKIDAEGLMSAWEWRLLPGVVPFPESAEVLAKLKGHGLQVGLITNASVPMRFRDRELRDTGLLEYFSDCRFAAVDLGYLKPHQQVFQGALDCLGISPTEAVFVGDNLEADIKGAQGVGMKAVLRLMPHNRDSDKPIVPDAKIETLHDLLPILDAWYPSWRGVTD